MAVTLYSDVSAQVPTLWSRYLRAQAENKTFWDRFEGPEGSSMPLIRKDNLTKEPGDTIKADLVLALTGSGISGDTNTLHGNEEKLKMRQFSFTVAELAHGVEWSERAQEHNIHNLRTTSRNQLAKWLAGKFDDANFSELAGTGNTTLPTLNKFFASTASSIATVNATAPFRPTLNEISELKAYAQATLKIEPMTTENGDEYFGLVLHPWAALALKEDTTFQAVNRDAWNSRAYDSPLFRGALGQWDGVIFYSNNRVPSALDGVSGTSFVARNMFFGAQAMTRGFSMYPDWREGEFDWGRFGGVATVLYKGEKMNVFDFSAAGDNSALQGIGHVVYYTTGIVPTPAS